jgi:hypothetical protein
MGTLGVIGFDAANPDVLLGLTCAHVACGKSTTQTGPVLHPPQGTTDTLGLTEKNGMSRLLPGLLIDCASVRITLGRPSAAGEIWSFAGAKINKLLPWGAAARGTIVSKYGAATGRRTGKILEHNFEWWSDDLQTKFSEVYKIQTTDPRGGFADHGDSGACVVAQAGASLTAVGIVIGITEPDARGHVFTVAAPIEEVLAKLGMKLF